MEEFITAIIVAALFYAVLRFFKISWLKQGFPHAFIYLAGVFAWCTALALIASVVSFISMVGDLIGSFDSDSLIQFILLLALFGAAAFALVKRKEVLDIAHMTPFLRSAILFQPYDAKRQDMLERKERMQVEQARKAAATRAASGQPNEDVMDISEDGFKGETTATTPAGDAPQTSSELGMLQRGESTDLSDLFKTNTAAKRSHPMYEFISLVRIEPSERVLTFKMILPPSATEPDLTPDKLQRIKHGAYQVFQALVVEPWLKPYLEYVASVRTSCSRVKKDEFDMTREFAFMTVEMTTANVKQYRGRPFNNAEFEKIATVTMEG